MDTYEFDDYNATSFQLSEHRNDFASGEELLASDGDVMIDNNQEYASEEFLANTTTTTNNESFDMEGGGMEQADANANMRPSTDADSVRKTMEDSVQAAANQLNDTLAETKDITLKCLQAITDYVNALAPIHNEWHELLVKEGEEKKHLDSLLPQIKNTTSQFLSGQMGRM